MKRLSLRYCFNLFAFSAIIMCSALFFLQFIGHSYFYARGYAHPGRLPLGAFTPASLDLAYEDVELTSTDGTLLKGWYIPSQNGASIILYHPLASNRIGTIEHAQMLISAGYGVLMMDIRSHGESGGDLLTYGGDEYQDGIVAINYLVNRPDVDDGKVGILGLSLGANFAVYTANHDARALAIVAEGIGGATFDDWEPRDWATLTYDWFFYRFLSWHTGIWDQQSLRDALATLNQPILLIGAGSEDLRVRTVAELQPNAEIWIIADASHISGIATVPEAYNERIIAFFNQHLLAN